MSPAAQSERKLGAAIAISSVASLFASSAFSVVALVGFGIGYATFLQDRTLTAGLAAIGAVAGAIGGAVAGMGLRIALRRKGSARRGLVVACIWSIVGAGGFATRPGAWWVVAAALGAITFVGAVAAAIRR
jgi:hypothetical protein